MTTEQAHISSTTCPRCYEPVSSTSWRPPIGFDPRLREFECKKCGYGFFQAIPGVVRREAAQKLQLTRLNSPHGPARASEL